jgi:hypothetical protein
LPTENEFEKNRDLLRCDDKITMLDQIKAETVIKNRKYCSSL